MSEQKEIPHIVYKREGCSSDNWCVHYAGLHDRMKPITHCEAGVEYDSVKKDVEWTHSYGKNGVKYTNRVARPCFRHEAHLANPCEKCRFPTEREIALAAQERAAHLTGMLMARENIVKHIAATKQFAGKIPCPVCKTGELHYRQAQCNKHIHAQCSTKGCVSWME